VQAHEVNAEALKLLQCPEQMACHAMRGLDSPAHQDEQTARSCNACCVASSSLGRALLVVPHLRRLLYVDHPWRAKPIHEHGET
jgi:hypothetical protein